MQQRIITVVLLIGLFFGLVTLVYGMSTWRLPDRETGLFAGTTDRLLASTARGRTSDRLSVLPLRRRTRVVTRGFRRAMSA